MADEPFPYLYRTIFTLLVGPDKQRYPVHKELLASKSSAVAKLIDSPQLYSQIKKSLLESLNELERLPKAAPSSSTLNCIVRCIMKEAIWLDGRSAPYGLSGTAADLRPLRKEVVEALHDHDWNWRPDTEGSNIDESEDDSNTDGYSIRQGNFIFYDLREHRELDVLDNAVAILIKGAKKQLGQHCLHPRETEDVEKNRLKLPDERPRVVEMLVHALYTSRLQTMDARSVFHDTAPYDRLQVFCLAFELGITSIQQLIVESFLKKRTGPTPLRYILFALAAAENGSPAKKLLGWLLRDLSAELLSVCPDGQNLSLNAVGSAGIDECNDDEVLNLVCDDCWAYMTSISDVLKHVAETDHENVSKRTTKSKPFLLQKHKPMFEEFKAKLEAQQRRKCIHSELFRRPVSSTHKETIARGEESSIWDSALDVSASTPRKVFRCDECCEQLGSKSEMKNHTDFSCHEKFSELNPDEIRKLTNAEKKAVCQFKPSTPEDLVANDDEVNDDLYEHPRNVMTENAGTNLMENRRLTRAQHKLKRPTKAPTPGVVVANDEDDGYKLYENSATANPRRERSERPLSLTAITRRISQSRNRERVPLLHLSGGVIVLGRVGNNQLKLID
ncbi:uncharacterized protein BDZ99DRAFT_569570 [Mytilinidion resinicola]|uniref:C2H2-type domain-containing protein n=1 Tax=Mytilinidion resinicola TaxID=574789 RepID=A0A6A6YRY0_9PEZI|nr:uncharacterized protein BDZ99DRAFT_569570 [Mytilinidion resinicola]KAF2811560.1 hypothetical protein BDZ99DRAFT_569570 [Mytilinidion resinicola]